MASKNLKLTIFDLSLMLAEQVRIGREELLYFPGELAASIENGLSAAGLLKPRPKQLRLPITLKRSVGQAV